MLLAKTRHRNSSNPIRAALSMMPSTRSAKIRAPVPSHLRRCCSRRLCGWRTVRRSPDEKPTATLLGGNAAHDIGKFFVHHSGDTHHKGIEPFPLVTRVGNEDVSPQLAHLH